VCVFAGHSEAHVAGERLRGDRRRRGRRRGYHLSQAADTEFDVIAADRHMLILRHHLTHRSTLSSSAVSSSSSLHESQQVSFARRLSL